MAWFGFVSPGNATGAVGANVDGRSGGGVPHDQPGLAGGDRRRVVDEGSQHRLARRVQVRNERDVLARRHRRRRLDDRGPGSAPCPRPGRS